MYLYIIEGVDDMMDRQVLVLMGVSPYAISTSPSNFQSKTATDLYINTSKTWHLHV